MLAGALEVISSCGNKQVRTMLQGAEFKAMPSDIDSCFSFAESHMTWHLKEGFNGRFSIESSCKVLDSEGKCIDEFFLLSGVMACSVLNGDSMLRDEPSYLFQAVYSARQHKVFRISPSFGDKKDSYQSGDNDHKVDFKLVKRQLKGVPINAGTNSAIAASQVMVGKLLLRDPILPYQYLLEFPVKHINTKNGEQAYQVEAGPVTLPASGMNPAQNINSMQIAYVAFNNRGNVEYTVLQPTDTDKNVRFFNKACRVKGWQQVFIN